jgi:hypothetical protein
MNTAVLTFIAAHIQYVAICTNARKQLAILQQHPPSLVLVTVPPLLLHLRSALTRSSTAPAALEPCTSAARVQAATRRAETW